MKSPESRKPENSTGQMDEADAMARERARQIVNRVTLRKAAALVQAWRDEEEAGKRLALMIGLTIFTAVAVGYLVAFLLGLPPKAQVFIGSLLASALVVISVVAWMKRRRN